MSEAWALPEFSPWPQHTAWSQPSLRYIMSAAKQANGAHLIASVSLPLSAGVGKTDVCILLGQGRGSLVLGNVTHGITFDCTITAWGGGVK